MNLDCIFSILVYMKNINLRNIPDDLHRQFKLLCVEKGTAMTDEVIRLIREEVKRNKKH